MEGHWADVEEYSYDAAGDRHTSQVCRLFCSKACEQAHRVQYEVK